MIIRAALISALFFVCALNYVLTDVGILAAVCFIAGTAWAAVAFHEYTL